MNDRPDAATGRPADAAAPTATTRVFVALAPPDDAKDELAQELRPAYETYSRMRWNRIEDWHITLAFLGELPVDVVPRLMSPLAALAARHRPTRLALHGGGHFDERVVWSGVTGQLDELHRLAADVRAVTVECGADFPARPFRPHLTLARARRGDGDATLAAATALDSFHGREWEAAHLHLVGSNIGRGPGPIRYRSIATWAFERDSA
ncbi:RNA 2',3'-cyclic phosphodiesterase [Streptomyces sp. NPDC101181]|uniref:RNA 2',3'-cyclic phosphodiesterase n=1 Tax=Streptomyces sp. NPDC101181 TaxID=3366125 RepID=UPI00380FD671